MVEGRGFVGEVGFVLDAGVDIAFPETCFFTAGGFTGSGGASAVMVVSASFSVMG